MIVPMKKASLVMLESRRLSALRQLRKAGVLHVESAGKTSAELDLVRENISLVDRAILALPAEKKKDAAADAQTSEPLKIAGKIAELADRKRTRREEADRLSREIERLENWGDFDPETLRLLNSRGVFARLYETGKKDAKKFGFNGLSYTAFSTKERTGIVAVSLKEEDFPAGFEPLAVPAKSLTETRAALAEKQKDIEALTGEIAGYLPYKAALETEAKKLKITAEFEQTAADLSSAEEKLCWLSGFVPETKIADLKAAAAKEGWGLLLDDPAEGEQVPTLLKNPKPVRLIKPVMDFLGLVPGYHERDISFFFILFFSIFVAMIIGDAGYATLFTGAALYFGLKTRKKLGYLPDAFILFIVMGIFTFIWGAMTANFFGINLIDSGTGLPPPPFSYMYVPWLGEQKNVQMICFILALAHLCIARIWDFLLDIRKAPRIKAFVHIGYLCLLAGLFTLVLQMLIDKERFPSPPWAKLAIGAGYLLVLFLSQQDGNFFKGMLMGLAQFIPTTLGCISVFADIISYVRLFAVGLAGLAIAQSFNTMAQGVMEMGGAGIAGGVLIIILGHTLNMGMCILSVVVHGVRLNVLEFSNHLGLEWSGFAYNPFREKENAQAS